MLILSNVQAQAFVQAVQDSDCFETVRLSWEVGNYIVRAIFYKDGSVLISRERLYPQGLENEAYNSWGNFYDKYTFLL